jgi:hypothetical protein
METASRLAASTTMSGPMSRSDSGALINLAPGTAVAGSRPGGIAIATIRTSGATRPRTSATRRLMAPKPTRTILTRL